MIKDHQARLLAGKSLVRNNTAPKGALRTKKIAERILRSYVVELYA